jgi:hypothetical protein
MLTSPPHPAHTTRRLARTWTTLTLLAAVLMMLACMSVAKLKAAPATNLNLSVVFEGGLAQVSKVKISVYITTTPNAWVQFAGHQKLSCNGVTIPEMDSGRSNDPPIRTVTIPRQPPGGAYTFVYTDEGGRQTTVVIPTPQVDLAVTQPLANARIPIPKTPSPTGEQNPELPRPESLASEPFQITYTVPFPIDALPVEDQKIPPIDQAFVSITGSCRHGKPTECMLRGGGIDASGSATISDNYTPYGHGFENFAPGPGAVALNMTVLWNMPDTGFNSFRVQYEDGVSEPVTWVEA